MEIILTIVSIIAIYILVKNNIAGREVISGAYYFAETVLGVKRIGEDEKYHPEKFLFYNNDEAYLRKKAFNEIFHPSYVIAGFALFVLVIYLVVMESLGNPNESWIFFVVTCFLGFFTLNVAISMFYIKVIGRSKYTKALSITESERKKHLRMFLAVGGIWFVNHLYYVGAV